MEETLKLQNIWTTKNSQDYLAFMKYEAENFNLILAPWYVDIY